MKNTLIQQSGIAVLLLLAASAVFTLSIQARQIRNLTEQLAEAESSHYIYRNVDKYVGCSEGTPAKSIDKPHRVANATGAGSVANTGDGNTFLVK